MKQFKASINSIKDDVVRINLLRKFNQYSQRNKNVKTKEWIYLIVGFVVGYLIPLIGPNLKLY